MMNEIWEDVRGYEGLYKVSNLGRVKSLRRKIRLRGNREGVTITVPESVLKGTPNGEGYLRVKLCKDGKGKSRVVHRLVAKSFIDNPERKPQVNHLNGIKSDNRIENLEWCTPSENMQHAFDTGLNHRGHLHNRTSLSKEDVLLICDLIDEQKMSHVEIAEEFGIQEAAVSSISRGRTWSHLTGRKPEPLPHCSVRKRRRVKNDRDQEFDSIKEAAKEFNIKRPSQISNVLNGNSRYAGVYEDTGDGIKWSYCDSRPNKPLPYSNKGVSLPGRR